MPSPNASMPYAADGQLVPSDPSRPCMVGYSLALSADGNTAAVGGPTDNGSVGAVWIFVRINGPAVAGTWVQQGPKLTGPGAIGAARFGAALALSGDGDTLLVGAPNDSGYQGAAWVFSRVDGQWRATGLRLTGSGNFGMSVALSDLGDAALIGAIGAPGTAGLAMAFTLEAGKWKVPGTRLVAADQTPNNRFGMAVALNADGDVALVGASGLGDKGGEGWIFKADDTGWNAKGSLLPARSDPAGANGFGWSVALNADGDVALIGCYGGGNSDPGGAWLYADDGTAWHQKAPRLQVPQPYMLGQSVGLSADGRTAVVGDFSMQTGGMAYVFTEDGGTWSLMNVPVTGNAAGYSGYGVDYAVAISADGHSILTAANDNNIDGLVYAHDNDRQLISHVFVLMLENHSFDNIFGLAGLTGITTTASGASNSYNGTAYPVSAPAPTSMPTDPGHEFSDVMEQLCGASHAPYTGNGYPSLDKSGYVSNYATTRLEITPGNPNRPTPEQYGEIMKCFNTPVQLPVVYTLAQQFALCDQWFSSLPGPTFPNRAFLHGGSSAGLADDPSDKTKILWATAHGFAHPNGNIFALMRSQGVVWRIYSDKSYNLHGWMPPMVTLLKGVEYIRDTADVTKFYTDVQQVSYPEGYTFIEPNYGDASSGSFKHGSSQHPMDGMHGGEDFIKQVYEAIRKSPHWNSSLLIVTYDEHGGFYDSFLPPPAPAPGDAPTYAEKSVFDFKQYGVRVPALVISPYVDVGQVIHTPLDHTSVLATLRKIFGVPHLTQRDLLANELRSLLTRSTPRTDCPMTLPEPAPAGPGERSEQPQAMAADVASAPIPATGALHIFLGAMLKTELEMTDGSPAARQAVLDNFQQIKTRGDAQAYSHRVGALAEQARQSRRAGG